MNLNATVPPFAGVGIAQVAPVCESLRIKQINLSPGRPVSRSVKAKLNEHVLHALTSGLAWTWWSARAWNLMQCLHQGMKGICDNAWRRTSSGVGSETSACSRGNWTLASLTWCRSSNLWRSMKLWMRCKTVVLPPLLPMLNAVQAACNVDKVHPS